MRDGDEDAAALLGLDEMVVRSRSERGGELWLEVETTASSAGCGECGTRATGHGRRRAPAPDAAGLGEGPRSWSGRDGYSGPGAVVPDRHLDGDPPRRSSARRSAPGRARAEIRRRVGEDEEVGRSSGSGLTGGLSRLR